MDEDKSSSNLLPVENTGSVGAPPDPAGGSRQALFTPQPEPVEPAGSMVAPEQPSTDLSHPYFSNHPAQTFNTEAGDIILNTGSPQTKQNNPIINQPPSYCNSSGNTEKRNKVQRIKIVLIVILSFGLAIYIL